MSIQLPLLKWDSGDRAMVFCFVEFIDCHGCSSR
ncbi:hypothetical protein SLEP1_g12848 [Rubroshorea leprosula]|uniref:Uncharacterized protein n=1 Tax=Rubroshorea leprosula TaxID=152421 RepID=A0AAV5IJW5_9ROSI|nr:hypothetical protein SLEP1_g12848 [Rubroshorea leprosula]